MKQLMISYQARQIHTRAIVHGFVFCGLEELSEGGLQAAIRAIKQTHESQNMGAICEVVLISVVRLDDPERKMRWLPRVVKNACRRLWSWCMYQS